MLVIQNKKYVFLAETSTSNRVSEYLRIVANDFKCFQSSSGCNTSDWLIFTGRTCCCYRENSYIRMTILRTVYTQPTPLLGEVLFLEECRRGPRHFWNRLACVGFSPVAGTHIKKALCRTLVYVVCQTAMSQTVMSHFTPFLTLGYVI